MEEKRARLARKWARDVCKTHLRARKSKSRCGLRQQFSTVSTGVEVGKVEVEEQDKDKEGKSCESPKGVIP